MRFVRSGTTACVAALAYFLAAALGALFHEHGQTCFGHFVAEHAHADDGCVLPGTEAASHSEHGDSLPAPLSDDDCAACRFVTQSALVVVATSATDLMPLVVELRVPAPSFFVEPIRACGLARAPPIG